MIFKTTSMFIYLYHPNEMLITIWPSRCCLQTHSAAGFVWKIESDMEKNVLSGYSEFGHIILKLFSSAEHFMLWKRQGFFQISWSDKLPISLPLYRPISIRYWDFLFANRISWPIPINRPINRQHRSISRSLKCSNVI